MTIIIQIGNTDNKLTQQDWSRYVGEVKSLIENAVLISDGGEIHGTFYSHSDAPWQNACFVIDMDDEKRKEQMKDRLVDIGDSYLQDSTAWTEGTTEFLR